MLEGVWDVKWEVSFGAGCIRLYTVLFFFSGHSGPFRSQAWPLPGKCQWAHGWYLSGTRVLGHGGTWWDSWWTVVAIVGCQPGDAGFRGFPSEVWRESNAEFSWATTGKWCSMMFVCGLNGLNFYTATLLKTRTAAPVRLLPLPAEDGHILSDSLSRMSCYVTLFASVWALHRMST